MATCKKRKARYVLTLTHDEAAAVCFALGCFGGADDPTEPAFDALYAALGSNLKYASHFKIITRDGCVPVIRRRRVARETA